MASAQSLVGYCTLIARIRAGVFLVFANRCTLYYVTLLCLSGNQPVIIKLFIFTS